MQVEILLNFHISLIRRIEKFPSPFISLSDASLNTFELSYFTEGGVSIPPLSISVSSQRTFELSYFTERVGIEKVTFPLFISMSDANKKKLLNCHILREVSDASLIPLRGDASLGLRE